MVLSNDEIRSLSNNPNHLPLIESINQDCVKLSSYKIKIGQIILPETGEVLSAGSSYLLKPSEVVMFKSVERINLPIDITANYTALYNISSKGLLLINASMIEPNYQGPLSGILLNFSAQPVLIFSGQEIAKLTFFKLNQSPSNANVGLEIIDDITYLRKLRTNAIGYHKSFLNIVGLEKSITNSVTGHVKSLLIWGGIIIGMLVLFATLEPITSKWLWEKTGVGTATEQYKMEKLSDDLHQIDIKEIRKIDINELKSKNVELQQLIERKQKLVNLLEKEDSIIRSRNGK